jgi:ferredoxin
MRHLNVVLRSGERRTIEASPGQSLKDGLMAGGIDEINAMTSCGGCCSCGTCHVYVEPSDLARLPPVGSGEDQMLTIHEDRRSTSRLSCQIVLTDELDGLSVHVAPEL